MSTMSTLSVMSRGGGSGGICEAGLIMDAGTRRGRRAWLGVDCGLRSRMRWSRPCNATAALSSCVAQGRICGSDSLQHLDAEACSLPQRREVRDPLRFYGPLGSRQSEWPPWLCRLYRSLMRQATWVRRTSVAWLQERPWSTDRTPAPCDARQLEV